MPIQIQDIEDQEAIVDCPLCMEVLEVDDINFFPCLCGYQICRFCWHRIRTDENGLCPACRKAYPEDPAEFKPLTEQEQQKIRQEKKQKEVARRQKITDGRKHLANVRVLQKNLVFVVGLSQRLADVEILKRPEYFGKYGKIIKVVLNSNTSYAGSQAPSCSAYVTYSKIEESLRAIQSVNNVHIDGRTLKASLGTTKYCSNYLKNQVCQKHDCMYLHEIGDEDASFTKEDMQMAKHQEYEQKLIQQMIQKEIQQELRNKALRQETSSDNGGASAGSSPPTGAATITSGLSVAQAVKKNTKMAPESTTNRPRRHSSSTTSPDPPETTKDIDFHGKNTAKGHQLSSSVGDRDPGPKAAGGGKGGVRRTGGKKNTNNQGSNQAPRHKKQQQQQQANGGSKKVPSRAHSASPSSSQNSQTWSTTEHSPPASTPVSTGASVESSPATTPHRDLTSATQSGPIPIMNDRASTASKVALRFSEESRNAGDVGTDRGPALPLDIPMYFDMLEDKNRDTPHSDSSSSIGRKSPFVRDFFSQDGVPPTNATLPENNYDNHTTVLTKSRFMMLHKETGNDPLSRIVSNGLGFSPFGTASHHAANSGLPHDLQTSENGLPMSQPASRIMPPPGLSAIMPNNTSGWPLSQPHLSDTMPIESTNDWEAAFGFKTLEPKPVVSPAEDDLGFDPWLECSKGLADLMEKEKTRETTTNMPPFSGSFGSSDPNAQRRPTTTLQEQNMHRAPQLGFHGGSDLVNGFSNFLASASQAPHHKMPFQLEQSRFLSQQRPSNSFPPNEPHPIFGSGNIQKQGLYNSAGPITPTKDQPGSKNSSGNMQEWQNGLRALLPTVNINFANQNHMQRSASNALESSLGLSNLGMPNDPRKGSGMPHPPGISNLNPFSSKHNVIPPPPGVGFGGRPSFMGGRPQQHQQWGGSESSMSTPGLPSNKLVSPAGMQSLFGSGTRSESNPIHGTMPFYPPDPAIIQGGMPGFSSTARRSRLFESPLNKSSVVNLNNNSNEEQPHWMKSLQALTEPDSPVNPAPPTSNTNSALGQLFSQQRQSNVPSWPNMPGLFSNNGYGRSQPPPGFQVRPSLSKPTEFGMLHNLLENQS